jgi:ATP phosphoribosyltransferase
MRREMILGIPSGSLLEPTLALLKKLGVEVIINGRNFIAKIRGSGIFSASIIMRPNDLPLAVKTGVVDAAITGFDMCLESGLEKEICAIAKLNFSKKSRVPTRVVVFCRQNDSDEVVDSEEVFVSSEYMHLASRIFKKANIVFSSGSTEIKIAIKEFGFRYGIGVVESGKSLEDNGLKIIKTIVVSPVVLIAQEETEEIRTLGQMLEGALTAELHQLVKFNAGLSERDALIKILPSMEAPTISNLADGAVMIETVVPRNILTDTVIAIKKFGGRDILIQDMNIAL